MSLFFYVFSHKVQIKKKNMTKISFKNEKKKINNKFPKFSELTIQNPVKNKIRMTFRKIGGFGTLTKNY